MTKGTVVPKNLIDPAKVGVIEIVNVCIKQ